MLPDVAMFEIFENDLWMNSLLVKLHDLIYNFLKNFARTLTMKSRALFNISLS